MSRVNLLPWRRIRRQRRQREFLVMLGAGALAAVLVVVVWQLIVAGRVSRQEERNAILRAEIANLDQKIREIKDLQAQKARLQARMDVIQELQVLRPMAVRLFDALARNTPDGVFLTSFAQRGTELSLQGWAQSNARIATFMHQLDDSDQFGPSKLRLARAGELHGMHASWFELSVPQRIAKNEAAQ